MNLPPYRTTVFTDDNERLIATTGHQDSEIAISFEASTTGGDDGSITVLVHLDDEDLAELLGFLNLVRVRRLPDPDEDKD